MKYYYKESENAFVRVDGRGRRIRLSYSIAEDICKLVVKGKNTDEICETLGLERNSTINTFINRFKNDDIIGFEPQEIKEEMRLFNKLKKWWCKW